MVTLHLEVTVAVQALGLLEVLGKLSMLEVPDPADCRQSGTTSEKVGVGKDVDAVRAQETLQERIAGECLLPYLTNRPARGERVEPAALDHLDGGQSGQDPDVGSRAEQQDWFDLTVRQCTDRLEEVAIVVDAA